MKKVGTIDRWQLGTVSYDLVQGGTEVSCRGGGPDLDHRGILLLVLLLLKHLL